MMEDKGYIGIVRGEATFLNYEFSVNPNKDVSFGEFVITKNRDGEDVLGIVRGVRNVNWILSSAKSTFNSIKLDVEEYGSSIFDNEEIVATVKVLGKIDDGELVPNRVPVKNGEFVYKASDDLLREIYKPDSPGVPIGTLLLRENVEISLDVNELISRHFAILAVTGAGKSNTVAVLIKGIVEDIGGTVVVLDPHGEYSRLRLPETGYKLVNVIDGEIRVDDLDPEEFADLIGILSNAHVQRDFLRKAWDTVKANNPGLGGRAFLDELKSKLQAWKLGKDLTYIDPEENKPLKLKLSNQDKVTIGRLISRIERFLREYGEFVTSQDLVASIRPGMANVINLSHLDEDQMKVIVGKFLERVFKTRMDYEKARKSLSVARRNRKEEYEKILESIENNYPALAYPILIVVEEAHIFAPQGEENNASRVMARIAREGRKFGVGLGVVSQRPSKLNEDILSQMNTKIILRIVNPRDQKYVLEASEQLSSDLMDDIAGLGKGEAVIVGQAIKVPALVKIYDFRELNGEYGGEDIGVLDRWQEMRARLNDVPDVDF
ncbi:DNA double-strand break repair helicase HerA [Pyrococcus abyssi]|uniref:Predicted ATPase n=1 Tax=Pyrococcus abyssi (strain GE5 / Orsay) TaxID=272844 RepID=Q9UZD0_PYRAB|nr:DNA double-strand break repair helicase HerA [Pyrococcus abyssi]CAB50129.1 Predicted ATPase [Pyrococcus abyssi GE5]CCE70654.1 TPA: hypothetical protein PAB0810 [Pyrococcus abyssi GE5]